MTLNSPKFSATPAAKGVRSQRTSNVSGRHTQRMFVESRVSNQAPFAEVTITKTHQGS
ncbi:hypothetical protein AVEN_162596-1, partial [Araneus ventricosus]